MGESEPGSMLEAVGRLARLLSEWGGPAEGGLARLQSAGHGGFDLDLMFVDSAFLESVVARATPVAIGGATLPVASVEDLLVMKLEAERPQDTAIIRSAC